MSHSRPPVPKAQMGICGNAQPGLRQGMSSCRNCHSLVARSSAWNGTRKLPCHDQMFHGRDDPWQFRQLRFDWLQMHCWMFRLVSDGLPICQLAWPSCRTILTHYLDQPSCSHCMELECRGAGICPAHPDTADARLWVNGIALTAQDHSLMDQPISFQADHRNAFAQTPEC